MDRQSAFALFKRPTCKGSYSLGSACGNCERCAWERNQRDPSEFIRPGWQVRVIAGWRSIPDSGFIRGEIVTATVTKVNRVCLSF